VAEKSTMMPTWKRIDPQISCFRRRNWLEDDFQEKGSRS